MVDRNYLVTIGAWREVWKLRIPVKVRHFAWRLCRGAFPLRVLLRRRHLNVPGECGLCNTGIEEERHLFAECDLARAVWRLVGMERAIEEVLCGGSFLEAAMKSLTTWDEHKKEVWVMILWSLWGERNQRVWSKVFRSPQLVVEAGMSVLQDWRKAKAKGPAELTPTSSAPVRCGKWHPPPVMRLKCNVDATFREQQLMWGWGVALWDHAGTLVAYRTGWQRGTPEIREGEAMALLDALRWATANGLGPTKFEVDSEEVAAAVTSHTKDDTEFGHIIELCRELDTLRLVRLGGIGIRSLMSLLNDPFLLHHLLVDMPLRVGSNEHLLICVQI
ncbi:hypothetical protein LINPERHAP1_LOCUS29697 [Linum perenne]